ncbi:hypothetical protein L7F22_001285 [Adiantum nelumboides]|nr:hypothetical protein [Adiantum nelumboides]
MMKMPCENGQGNVVGHHLVPVMYPCISQGGVTLDRVTTVQASSPLIASLAPASVRGRGQGETALEWAGRVSVSSPMFVCLTSPNNIDVGTYLRRVLQKKQKSLNSNLQKIDFDIIIRPTLEGWCQGGHDKVLLKKLNTDNIRIVSSILGQSIALDHFGRKVDTLVNIFSDLNQKMEETGTFTMKRAALFKVVATANTTLADVILRLGLLERSDAAWKNANYAVLWEFLREEYELDARFESFDFKLEIIQHNVRFFLEILQNRKSDTLEWIIILLIAGEICVSLYEILHGSGVF